MTFLKKRLLKKRLAAKGIRLYSYRQLNRHRPVVMEEGTSIWQVAIEGGPRLSIGAHTSIGRGSRINEVSHIGRFCSIGKDVILGPQSHPMGLVSTHPFLYSQCQAQKLGFEKAPIHHQSAAPLIIGNDVWIGDGACIMAGITIGDGAVIGAKAVVTRDVPPYSIVAGVPAKVLRPRFDADTAKRLQQSRWWTLELTGLEQQLLDPQQLLMTLERGPRPHKAHYNCWQIQYWEIKAVVIQESDVRFSHSLLGLDS